LIYTKNNYLFGYRKESIIEKELDKFIYVDIADIDLLNIGTDGIGLLLMNGFILTKEDGEKLAKILIGKNGFDVIPINDQAIELNCYFCKTYTFNVKLVNNNLQNIHLGHLKKYGLIKFT
jgi:hypothetical protein